MHSVYQRLNAVWASGVMVLCFMLAFNHITSLAVQPVVSGSIAVHSLERLCVAKKLLCEVEWANPEQNSAEHPEGCV